MLLCSMQDKKQIVKIPHDIWKKMMLIKADTGKHLKDQIIEALQQYTK